MNKRATLAVVDDSHFYTCGKKWEHEAIDCLARLASMAEYYGLKHVWIVPGTRVSQLAHEPFVGYEWKGDLPDWNVTAIGKDAFSYLSVRRGNARHEDHIEIGLTEWSRWPWEGDTDPRVLLATLLYLEETLGFPVAWTPAWCSIEFVRRQNANHWQWFTPMTLDLESAGFSYKDDIAKELHWPPKGVAMPVPPGATHHISIDTNSAYAAGMTGLNIGEGNPEWTDVPNGVYNGKIPGIWKIHTGVPLSECLWDGIRLPDFYSRQWATTDLIEQMRRSNILILVEAGWHWGTPEDKKPKYHQTLRSTAEALWDRRIAWRAMADKGQAHQNVHESLRTIIKAIHGKMARPDIDKHFRRRDIWGLTVARSVAMRIYWIEKIYREFGVLPVKIKADELTYGVNDPHIFDGMLDRDKLGGFKLVRSVEIS